MEPYEELDVDIPPEYLGDIMQSLASRKAEITHMEHHPHTVELTAVIPTRGLIGFETVLVNTTKGHGIMSALFHGYGPHKGEIPSRNNGVLVSMEGGVSTAYALDTIQERGRLFIDTQEEIYEGMIVGENSRNDDMPVNPCRAKKLTNMRSQGDGKGIALPPALKFSLERSLEYIAPDEYVEVTPKSLRLRKKILDANARKRAEKKETAV
jgi:GTP-binding protein